MTNAPDDPREDEHDDHCGWFDLTGCNCGLFDRIEEWDREHPDQKPS